MVCRHGSRWNVIRFDEQISGKYQTMNINKTDRLLLGLLEGDTASIKEIYSKLFPLVRAFVCSNKGNTDDAYDIFHDALLYIIVGSKEGSLRIKAFKPYLMVVCKNLWKRKLKSRVIKSELNTLEDTPTDLSLYFFEQAAYDFYIEKFQLLSANCKEVLAHYFNGWSYEELLKELNYNSINTVRQRVFKCRSKLIQLIKTDARYKKMKTWKKH